MISNLVEGKSNEKKSIAHFKVTFVNSVPPSYLCSLCSELFKFPCHVNCCQIHFCQECIGRIKQMERPCPNCLENDFMIIFDMSDSTLKTKIDSLKVYCPMRKSGCKWTGKLSVLDDHLMWGEAECPDTTCRVIPVQCLSGCGSVIARGSINDHLRNSCKRRETSCKYCGLKDSYDQLTTVHYSICHKYHVSCPNGCKMPGVERGSLKTHLEAECPFRNVYCEFHFAGCGEEFLVSEQLHHATTAISVHLSLLSTFTRSIQVENKELRTYCTRLEKVCASLQRDYARLAADFVHLQNAINPENVPQDLYQNDQKKGVRHKRPLPPLPFSSAPQKFQTQPNQSYSLSSDASTEPTSAVTPVPQLKRTNLETDSCTLNAASPPPPVPPCDVSMYQSSSQPSTSSVDWLPSNSTDISDQLSPLSYEEEDLFSS